MELDRFKSAWQSQEIEPSVDRAAADIVTSIERRLETLNRTILWRDGVETGSALAGIVLFGCLFFVLRGALVKSGAALITAGLALIIFRLRSSSRKDITRRADVSVADFCAGQAAALDRQIALLRSVAWWYLGPVIIGVNLFFVGLSGPNRASLIYLVATLVFAVVVYRLNISTVRHKLVPVRRELASILEELRHEEQ